MALLTGSRRYGTPRPDSDIDVVMRVDDALAQTLRDAAGVITGEPVKFGKLNLILCENDDTYGRWDRGTMELITITEDEERPITRAEAVAHFKALGVSDCGARNQDGEAQ